MLCCITEIVSELDRPVLLLPLAVQSACDQVLSEAMSAALRQNMRQDNRGGSCGAAHLVMPWGTT